MSIHLQTHGKDKYGLTIADVLLPDGTNANHTLVKDGWCLWYRKYAPVDTVQAGGFVGGLSKTQSLNVWCVRGGKDAEAY